MKKLYFIIPILACAVFYIFYSNKKEAINADIQHNRELREQEAAERVRRANEERRQNYEKAMAESLKRQEEREARKRKEQADAERKEKAVTDRDLAYRDRDRQLKYVNKLKEDLSMEKAAMDKINEQITIQQEQVKYLKEEVPKITQTRTVYEQALIKINAAEKARAEAERAAQQQQQQRRS
jgi:hypothetical protein